MCMAHEMKCTCGARSASFHFKDNIMPEQVVRELYCPACASSVAPDDATMVSDNGWIIRYDMEVAKAVGGRISADITPGLLFDEGYCTWNGMYPGDHIDSVRERESITAMAKTDPVGYLKKLKTWATERSARLKDAGWRKAQNAA
jgi:hypothetical protein